MHGEWSRFDLMTRPAEFGRGAVGSIQAAMPASAHSLYYRDSIGNISSSRELRARDSAELK